MSSTGLTAGIAAFVHDADSRTIPATALREAERAFVDTIGVARAAADDNAVRTLLRALDDGAATGPARSWVGSPPRQPAQMALVNGTAAHAFDFDDASQSTQTHPSSVLCAAAMAVGQNLGATGLAVLDAYAVGYQVQSWIATALGRRRHYALGWHSTSTIGILGAAASAARLYDLGPGQVAMALGVAGTMASGSRSNFGTMTKPFHAGMAAARGVEAALLAREGFTAGKDMLESDSGYLQLFRDDRAAAAGDLDEPWALGGRGLSIKRYPACYCTHCPIDAVLDLPALDIAAIDEVRVQVQPGGLTPLIHHRPEIGLEGKFSLEYAVAAALTDRRVDLQSFSDEAVARPRLQELLRKVQGEEVPAPTVGEPTWSEGFACVAIGLADGRTISGRRDFPRGHARAPLSDEELQQKFASCMKHVGYPDGEVVYNKLNAMRDITDVAHLDF